METLITLHFWNTLQQATWTLGTKINYCVCIWLYFCLSFLFQSKLYIFHCSFSLLVASLSPCNLLQHTWCQVTRCCTSSKACS